MPTSPSPGGNPEVAKFLKDGYFVCGIHPAAHSIVSKQCSSSGVALGNVYNDCSGSSEVWQYFCYLVTK